MRLTENTKVRIKVPKHLYESIKEELEGQYEMEDSANLEEMEAERVAAESMMHAISSGDPFWTGVGLVLGIAGTIFAGAKAKDAKDKLIGWWKGLSAQQKAEAGKHLDTDQASGEGMAESEKYEEMEEAVDFQTLMEAIKDAAKKKKDAKAKEKEKAAKEKEAEEAKKKKEAEAKKKAAAAKKK